MIPLLLSAWIAVASPVPDVPQPTPQALADGVWLIAGGFPLDRQPDGNTIVWQAPQGLIVMDTGRHPAHYRAILDFAAARHAPVAAIINSHWHLDHTSGNAAIKAAWPKAKLYTGTAVLRMIRDYFPKGIASSQALVDGHQLPAAMETTSGWISRRASTPRR